MKGLAAFLRQILRCLKILGDAIQPSASPANRGLSRWATATNVWACVPCFLALPYYGNLAELPGNVFVCDGSEVDLPGGTSYTLPDLVKRYPRGCDSNLFHVGDEGGAEKHIHTIPPHAHLQSVHQHGMDHRHQPTFVDLLYEPGGTPATVLAGLGGPVNPSTMAPMTDTAGGGGGLTDSVLVDPNDPIRSADEVSETESLDPHSYCNYVMRLW